MEFFGMTIFEISALLGVVGILISVVAWMLRKAYQALKKNIVDPLTAAISELAKNIEEESRWIHERHSEVVHRLDDHEELLDKHDTKLTIHEERIRTLFDKEGRK